MIHERVILTRCYADVAELADAPDLGSGVPDVQVQVLSSAGLETFHLNFIRVIQLAARFGLAALDGRDL